jgi:hypothetical protein
MTEPSAHIVADSISPDGHRCTTFQATMHRFVLAEFNTHCVFDRNSASSRAIPLAKQLNRVRNDPAIPIVFPAEQPGMQGGAEVENPDMARRVWLMARQDAVSHARDLGTEGVHKSVANRLLEPFMWHTVTVTATAYENFFGLRCSPMAQPEIRAVAELMHRLYEESVPSSLSEGMWHLPYILPTDWDEADQTTANYAQQLDMLCRVSAARVARTSYLTQDGKRDMGEDLNLYERLTSARPMHASPLGQVARVDSWNQITHDVPLPDGSVFALTVPKVGKLLGYRALRHDVEMASGYQSFS